jgi:hypothetical protein
VSPSRRSLTLLDDLLGTSDETGSSGGDETDLLTSGLVSSDGRRVTNMLMVTTTMGMLDGVHRNTSNSGPVVSLGLLLEPRVVSLQERLVSSLTASSDADHGSALALDGLSGTGRELDSGLSTLISVTDDDGGSTGGSGERSSITVLGLTVGNNGTFGKLVDGENISNGERGLGASVDKLSSEHSLDSDEIFDSLLVPVRVSEDNLGKWRTSARIMNNVLHNTLDVALLLSIIERSESRRGDLVGLVRSKNKTTTVSLGSNTSTHD